MASADDIATFGRILKEERTAKGLSRQKLGDLLGLSGSRIGQFEDGDEPSPDQVFAMEDAMELPIGRLSLALGYTRPVSDATDFHSRITRADPATRSVIERLLGEARKSED